MKATKVERINYFEIITSAQLGRFVLRTSVPMILKKRHVIHFIVISFICLTYLMLPVFWP